MSPLSQQILTHAKTLPEGTPLVARELLHFGGRSAIDQALSRLSRRGKLIRGGRGLYLLPVVSRFGVRAPELRKVAEAFAKYSGETVVPNEAASANALGLTTQVPVRPMYLTSGKSRHLKLGKQVLELKHVPTWKLLLAHRPAGQALRALAGAGPTKIHNVARQLSNHLSQSELVALAATPTHYMPVWIARELKALKTHG